MRKVSQVEIRNISKPNEDITNIVVGKTIEITLSNGKIVEIEFFERDGFPAINIIGDDIYVMPHARNVVRVGNI